MITSMLKSILFSAEYYKWVISWKTNEKVDIIASHEHVLS